MKKLLDAFLELPTWQGVALIVAFCAFETALCSWVAFWALRRGRFEADAEHLRRFNQHAREREAIRL